MVVVQKFFMWDQFGGKIMIVGSEVHVSCTFPQFKAGILFVLSCAFRKVSRDLLMFALALLPVCCAFHVYHRVGRLYK